MNFAEIFLKLVVLLAAEKDEITDDPNVTNSLLCPSEIAGKKHEQKIPYTIYIEGNVGCGKSTFLELFRGDPNIQIVQEPVAEWQNVSGSGIDMLDLMFSDGPRWSGTFQLLSTYTRLQSALNISTDTPVRMMERSLFSERFCFVENQRRMNKLADVEYVLSDQWFNFINKHFHKQIKPDLIVYLRADLTILKERIKKRARVEEAHIEPGFLEGLQEYHDDWLYYKNSSFPIPSRVLVLDSNLDLKSFVSYVQSRKFEIFPRNLMKN